MQDSSLLTSQLQKILREIGGQGGNRHILQKPGIAGNYCQHRRRGH